MNILVVNCGSSSIKFVLSSMPENKILAKGGVEKLGMQDAFIKYRTLNMDEAVVPIEAHNHTKGIECILEKLTEEHTGCISSLKEISAVGHRLVHGADKFSSSCVITDEVLSQLKECIPLAPLHNPANIMGIEAVTKVLPNIKQVGVFDTAFHQTMPKSSYLYALPYELYTDYNIRRYGFHGISHKYVSKKAADLCGVDINNSKIITAHIGNGASMTAILNGKSMDTSMGLTPTEGLIMGTRCGDIDCGITPLLLDNPNWRKDAISKYLDSKTIEQIKLKAKKDGCSEDEKVLLYSAALSKMYNNFSGVKSIAGINSSDMRDISSSSDSGNDRSKLSLEMYNYHIKKYVGAYAAAMGGCDILVFTAGVGENKPNLRAEVCKGLSFMGIDIDETLNNQSAQNMIISKTDSKVKVVVIKTDEEYMIANDTYNLTK